MPDTQATSKHRSLWTNNYVLDYHIPATFGSIVMNPLIRAIISWAIAIWCCYIFLASLPYKFTRHPDTQHIFGTIGEWLGSTIMQPLGELFTAFGSYIVGGFELITSLILLAPALLWTIRKLGGKATNSIRPRWHAYGGLMASTVMAGAVFFHLVTPLGIEVIHNGQSDGGSLFFVAVSIAVLGVVLFLINIGAARQSVNPDYS